MVDNVFHVNVMVTLRPVIPILDDAWYVTDHFIHVKLKIWSFVNHNFYIQHIVSTSDQTDVYV